MTSDASAMLTEFDFAKLDFQRLNRCVLVVLYVLLVNAHRNVPRREAKGVDCI